MTWEGVVCLSQSFGRLTRVGVEPSTRVFPCPEEGSSYGETHCGLHFGSPSHAAVSRSENLRASNSSSVVLRSSPGRVGGFGRLCGERNCYAILSARSAKGNGQSLLNDGLLSRVERLLPLLLSWLDLGPVHGLVRRARAPVPRIAPSPARSRLLPVDFGSQLSSLPQSVEVKINFQRLLAGTESLVRCDVAPRGGDLAHDPSKSLSESEPLTGSRRVCLSLRVGGCLPHVRGLEPTFSKRHVGGGGFPLRRRCETEQEPACSHRAISFELATGTPACATALVLVLFPNALNGPQSVRSSRGSEVPGFFTRARLAGNQTGLQCQKGNNETKRNPTASHGITTRRRGGVPRLGGQRPQRQCHRINLRGHGTNDSGCQEVRAERNPHHHYSAATLQEGRQARPRGNHLRARTLGPRITRRAAQTRSLNNALTMVRATAPKKCCPPSLVFYKQLNRNRTRLPKKLKPFSSIWRTSSGVTAWNGLRSIPRLLPRISKVERRHKGVSTLMRLTS